MGAPPDDGEPDALPVDVGGGVEIDALAPVCAATWRAQMNDSRSAEIERPAMVICMVVAEDLRSTKGGG